MDVSSSSALKRHRASGLMESYGSPDELVNVVGFALVACKRRPPLGVGACPTIVGRISSKNSLNLYKFLISFVIFPNEDSDMADVEV
jgi:hypothetical protein